MAAATTSAPYESSGRPSGAAAARSERLFADHQRMVLGLCRALLRDPAEAEDAAQQVFLSAHRSLLGGAEPREPAAWLATIARNECWRRISGRMRTPLATAAAEDVPGTDDPVAAALRRADLAALWQAIRMLPQQQREALLLREFGGLRYDELAAALAVSEPAVESLLFRARSRLRVQLQAAYAALTGASWLESLARLVAGGGTPALATKAAALTLGAAAVTGGAVVAPQLLDHQGRRPAQPHRPVVPREAVLLPVAPPTTVATAAPVVAAPRPAGRHRSSAQEDRVGSGGGSDDGRTGRTEGSRSDTRSGGGGDRGGSSSGSDGSGSSGSDSGSDGSGPGRDGGSDGPGVTTPTVEIAPTVPVVTLPETEDGSGDGGHGG